MTILVTGGAGYIGSHMVNLLRARRQRVVVVDNFSSGHEEALPPDVPLLEADIADQDEVAAFLKQHAVTSVIHFASRIQVGESMREPRLYYRDNLASTVTLLDAVLDAGVGIFIFSSSAAVYGAPSASPLAESHPTLPINPYGATKLAVERMLADYATAYGLKYAALRYFNASGANWRAGLGERHEPETHLIPLVLDVAWGRRPQIDVFGGDYPTPDGTCIRDYIHVEDLADAHLAAIEYLANGGESGAFNLGSGTGYSVKEVVDTARSVTGHPIPMHIGARREGDPPELVAGPAHAQQAFNWRAHRSSLRRIVEDAWRWHKFAHAEGTTSINQHNTNRETRAT